MSRLEIKFNEILRNPSDDEMMKLFIEVREALERGQIRVAEKVSGKWIVNRWIKEVILWGFKLGKIEEVKSGAWPFFDKDTMPVINFSASRKIRLVPGGSSVRAGAFVAEGTVIMPPSYINTGAYIDSGCMADSHALVGSCAQIGKNVHISAASQVGGVLEPAGALPVIIEDGVFVGGNCGIYEGTIVRKNAVIATGVILNGSTPVFDNTSGMFIRKEEDGPLVIPEGAVLVSGSRPVSSGPGSLSGIHIYCPVIIKYRDERTDVATTLEKLLR